MDTIKLFDNHSVNDLSFFINLKQVSNYSKVYIEKLEFGYVK